MAQGGEEEGAELAPAAVGQFDIFVFEEAREEVLGDVLGVMRRVALPSGKSINGIPVGLAEPLQGLGGSGGTALPRLQHDTPVSGGKTAGLRLPGIGIL